MRSRRWVMVVWACFLARLLFYSAMLPLWEGYDEWAHFAVVRQTAIGGHLLVSRDAPIPRDAEASLQLAPVAWELRSLASPSVTHDEYGGLSGGERDRRERALRTMPVEWGREDGTGALKAYEALQPPLYYWMMAPALWLCRGLGLLGQVLVLRFLSSLVASCVVPLVFLLGIEVWGEGRAALGCAAIVAVMPGLALDVARVSNDCLAVVLFTLLTWLVLKAVREGLTLKLAPITGLVLGLGLLTKAYFLTAIPALFLVAAWCWWGRWFRLPILWRTLVAAFIAVLVAGWWYIRNLQTTGTLSGLSESTMLRGVGAGEMLHQAAGIHWPKAIDAIFLSHLYFGGWSSLTVRSWMYHLFYIVILAAAVGLARSLRRPAILALLAVYLCFWLGQLYNVILLYMSKGLEGSMGWYMYAVVGAEVVLCVAGLQGLLDWLFGLVGGLKPAPPRPDYSTVGRASTRQPARRPGARWIAVAGAAMFALLDLYTVHAVAIPYYTGMIRHRANGSLEALHAAGFQRVGIVGAVERLTGLVPAPMLIALWLLYVVGTAGALACAGARECDSAAKSQT